MAKPVLKLVAHLRPWGSTSGLVILHLSSLVTSLNSPAPFETVPDLPDWNTLHRNVTQICDQATSDKRKGMMISSRFRVELEGKCVKVWHIRNEKEPRLFLTIEVATP